MQVPFRITLRLSRHPVRTQIHQATLHTSRCSWVNYKSFTFPLTIKAQKYFIFLLEFGQNVVAILHIRL